MNTGSLLQASDIETCYGASQVLFGMSIDVKAGEVVTLLGRNGMGKSTLVKTVTGLMAPRRGSVRLAGKELAGRSPHHVARAGVGLGPEGRRVFANLSVRENLVATAANRHGSQTPWTLDRIYAMFPRLRERERNLACNLSGGEQQMLAIGRALMTNPALLLLDEPMEGLAPIIVEELASAIRKLCEREGLASIVVEQHPVLALEMTHQAIVLERGTVVHAGPSEALAADHALLDRLLGVGMPE